MLMQTQRTVLEDSFYSNLYDYEIHNFFETTFSQYLQVVRGLLIFRCKKLVIQLAPERVFKQLVPLKLLRPTKPAETPKGSFGDTGIPPCEPPKGANKLSRQETPNSVAVFSCWKSWMPSPCQDLCIRVL